MVDKEVIKFIKKNNIIQEYVSRGNLPLFHIENMLQRFKDEIIKKENNKNIKFLKEILPWTPRIKVRKIREEINRLNDTLIKPKTK